MGKDKNKTKNNGLLTFKGMRIEARLKKAFNMIIVIASIGSVVGILSLMIVVSNFEKAMENYALPQGDIALFMNEYAECRSNMRGIIGYYDMAERLQTILAEAAQDLAEGATDQAASVQEMLATMNTVSDGLKDTSTSVEEAYKQALKCADDAQVSRTEMGNMVESMNLSSQKIINIGYGKFFPSLIS